MSIPAGYAHWLHLRWPAGTVEKLPVVGERGRTNVPGVRIVGDLTGVPLLKFAADSGARAVQDIMAEPGFQAGLSDSLDLAIIGAGPAGLAAALEAQQAGLRFEIFEATEPLSTIVNFPRAKPIYTYPTAMTPAGRLRLTADVKESLYEELESQRREAGIEPRHVRIHGVRRVGGELVLEDGSGGAVQRARRVVVAVGRSGNFRTLGVPGEHMDKVYNRLHDPADFAGKRVLVVGGGDSAVEAAIALVCGGSHVTRSYRGTSWSRPKDENVQKLNALLSDESVVVEVPHPSSERVTTAVTEATRRPVKRGTLDIALDTTVESIADDRVVLRSRAQGTTRELRNDAVFVMIGREAPLDFFRRSGVAIAGEMRPASWVYLALFVLFCAWLYNWKSGGFFDAVWRDLGWFPYSLAAFADQAAAGGRTLWSIIVKSAVGSAFWYTLAYSIVVVTFGFRRMRRRKTPYVRLQTWVLMAVQVIPLFLLPEILLPWLDSLGWLPAWLADPLFPAVDYGHGREFWRAYGFILAWPLNVYNVFTAQPLWAWIGIGFLQTFVIIPLGIYRWGKGFYCGWICSCGALAETLGDTYRHKMPHGPASNRWNLAGQVVLAVAVALLIGRITGWVIPGYDWFDAHFGGWLDRYKWTIDVGLAGVLGYGVYFWYSGRVWCRFLCPLAALMHIYARFSRFRIFAQKSKCISCNVCTSVCHMGIDVMNFANKGVPLEDPECVRCSACVQSCPTGVLSFGRVDGEGRAVPDRVVASLIPSQEVTTSKTLAE